MKNTLLLPAALFLSFAAAAQTDAPVTEPATDDQMGIEETTDPASDYSSPAETAPMDDATMDTDASMAGTEVSATSTLAAAKEAGGLTKLSPDAAVANIDGWIAKLDGVEGGSDIQTSLETLKVQLTASTIDGAAVATTLSELSTATEGVAGEDTELKDLAKALKKASGKLK